MGKKPIPSDIKKRHRAIAEKMSYRGPDRLGHFSDETYCVYVNQHNITSQVDNIQPVKSENDSLICALNGELYNYAELNVELERLGFDIRTPCDTETLLRLFQSYEEKCLSRIDGMFATAIYDKQRHRLILARDRFGEKPLFYIVKNGFLHFCSESNYLVEFSDKQISDDGLLQYLAFGFSRDHLFCGIRRLQPGTFLTAHDQRIRVAEYWKPTFETDYGLEETIAINRAYEILRKAVELRIPQGLKYGAYISGGIDSSIVACLLAKQRNPLDLFTSGLIGLGKPDNCLPVDKDYISVEIAGNELNYADILAASINAEYHRCRFSVQDVIENLPSMVAHLPGGPVMSTSFPLFYFSAIESQGFRVAFAGEGSDELHGGYETTNPDHYDTKGFSGTYVKLSDYFRDEDLSRMLGERSISRLTELCELWDNEIERDFEGDSRKEDMLFNKIRFFQIRYAFCPHLLEKADGMTMGFGPTELRQPFLSRDYSDFALSFPKALCRSNKTTKYLVTRVARKAGVPEDIIHRELKQRTSLPYYNLFYRNDDFRRFVLSLLNKHSLVRQIIRLDDPGEYIYGLDGSLNAHKRAWTILILEIWLRNMFS